MNSAAFKINVKQISKSPFSKFVFHRGMDATILDLIFIVELSKQVNVIMFEKARVLTV